MRNLAARKTFVAGPSDGLSENGSCRRAAMRRLRWALEQEISV